MRAGAEPAPHQDVHPGRATGRATGRDVEPGRRPGLPRWALAAIFLLALAPRLVPAAPFLTWDEPTWTVRSLRFARALETGRLAETVQSAHPGVLTMWAGAAAIHLHLRLLGPPEDTWRAPGAPPSLAATRADLAWVDQLPPFDEDDVATLRSVLPWLYPARAAVALLGAALVALCAACLGRLAPPAAAALGGALLALDPYHVAHGRVLHLDALLALLILASALAALVARARIAAAERGADGAGAAGGAGDAGGARGARTWLTASGALGGLALVEKSPGLIALPFAALVVATTLPARAGRAGWRAALGGAAADGALWLAAAAAAYGAAWPALWVAPGATLGRMAAYAAEAAGGAREAVFFAGRVRPDPGPVFYLAALAWRQTPLITLGLLLGVVGAVRSARRGRPSALLLVALAALVLLAMGLGAKKFERYALPAAGPLDLVAALGLYGALRRADARARGRPAVRAALAALLALGLLLPLRDHPYELATYNDLLGGAGAARRVLPVGWGEGSERAVAWLNARPGAAALRVATPSMTLVGPRFAGETLPAKRWPEADYVVLYVDDVQIGEPKAIMEAMRPRAPAHVVRLGEMPYAWIYRVAP